MGLKNTLIWQLLSLFTTDSYKKKSNFKMRTSVDKIQDFLLLLPQLCTVFYSVL